MEKEEKRMQGEQAAFIMNGRTLTGHCQWDMSGVIGALSARHTGH